MSNTNDIILFNLCQQRSRRQLFSIPPIRTELQASPYNTPIGGKTYNQFQLDMRRKAEILKYSSNAQSTQTNNLTKSQKWSQIVNGSTAVINNLSVNTCPADQLIPTPTSSCDVPGPIIYLYDDETVPLYNYATNTRSYGITETHLQPFYDISTNYGFSVVPNTDQYETLSTVYVRTSPSATFTPFNIQNMSIALNISGTIGNIFGNTSPISVNVSISSLAVSLFYNETIVNSTDNTQIVAMDGCYTLPSYPLLNTSIIDLSFTIVSLDSSFNVTQFIGSLNLDNMLIYTVGGNIYDAKTEFNTFISYSTVFDASNISISPVIICNLPGDTIFPTPFGVSNVSAAYTVPPIPFYFGPT
jgi:hypothetical protein